MQWELSRQVQFGASTWLIYPRTKSMCLLPNACIMEMMWLPKISHGVFAKTLLSIKTYGKNGPLPKKPVGKNGLPHISAQPISPVVWYVSPVDTLKFFVYESYYEELILPGRESRSRVGLKDVLVVSDKNILMGWWKHTAFIVIPLSHIQLLPLLADS